MFGFDINIQEDWGNGPDVASGYDYPSPLAALDAALDCIDFAAALCPTWAGRSDENIGIYVFEEPEDQCDSAGWSWSPAMLSIGGPILSGMDSQTADIYV